MPRYEVLTWRAEITYGNVLHETETVIGPLRALECYIRYLDDRISCVTLSPHTHRS